MTSLRLGIFWPLLIFSLTGCAATVTTSKSEMKAVQEAVPAPQQIKQDSAKTALQPMKEAATPKAGEVKPVLKDIVKIRIETSKGPIEADLYAKETPKTVENFLTLAKKGFYDGIIFHRVIPGFMIQTGDPTGTGRGGPEYTFEDEFSPNLRHNKAGVISMANRGPNTNGSQFFITEGPTPHLDDRHTVFGQVTNGIEVVHSITTVQRDPSDKPLEPVKMTKVIIVDE